MTILSYIAIGLAIGSVSGVMGIGGGVLLVPGARSGCSACGSIRLVRGGDQPGDPDSADRTAGGVAGVQRKSG